MASLSENRLEKEKVRRGLEPTMTRETTIQIGAEDGGEKGKGEITVNPFVSHAELVVRGHQRYRELTGRSAEDATAPTEKIAEDANIKDLEDSRKNYSERAQDTEESAAKSENAKEETDRNEGLARTGEKEEPAAKSGKAKEETNRNEGLARTGEKEEPAAKSGKAKEETNRNEGLARTGEKEEPAAKSGKAKEETNRNEGLARTGEKEEPDRSVHNIDAILREGDKLFIPTASDAGDRKLETEMLDEILMYASEYGPILVFFDLLELMRIANGVCSTHGGAGQEGHHFEIRDSV